MEKESASKAMPPMPTYEELKAQGLLYKQLHPRYEHGNQIVKHLFDHWWTWIEAGMLTQPELRKRDPEAYRRLYSLISNLRLTGQTLKDVLAGYDIPGKSQLVDCEVMGTLAQGISPDNRMRKILKRREKQGHPYQAIIQFDLLDIAPMPTNEELAEKGLLYNQLHQREKGNKIVDHLRQHWWPWIEAGVLTRTQLHWSDPAAAWRLMQLSLRLEGQGKTLKDVLGGHDIPTRSQINEEIATAQ
jgi:hypothetical protein